MNGQAVYHSMKEMLCLYINGPKSYHKRNSNTTDKEPMASLKQFIGIPGIAMF